MLWYMTLLKQNICFCTFLEKSCESYVHSRCLFPPWRNRHEISLIAKSLSCASLNPNTPTFFRGGGGQNFVTKAQPAFFLFQKSWTGKSEEQSVIFVISSVQWATMTEDAKQRENVAIVLILIAYSPNFNRYYYSLVDHMRQLNLKEKNFSQ